MAQGILYIVATPIGNLDDITLRALRILQDVDLIAAEDTRHSRKLLEAHGIETSMVSLHEHNEHYRATKLIERLVLGESIALISDAGTPLISDPGYGIVAMARQHGIDVVPVPGPCAAITALSASGLPTDRFTFVGFLPSKSGARRKALQALQSATSTLVFYESPRRLIDVLQDIESILGADRTVCVAKELTKTFERFVTGQVGEVSKQFEANPQWQKGEFVVLVEGCTADDARAGDVSAEVLDLVSEAAQWLPLKKACALVAKMTGVKKNRLYQVYLGQMSSGDNAAKNTE